MLRHGESQWNLENRFTGWTDINLTKRGIREAKNAGKLLNKESFKFDLVFTSLLKRANRTMKICLERMNLSTIKTQTDWRLNERHYGALQGLNKTETAQKYGEDQVLLWRRSYKETPPKLDINDKRHPRFDIKYHHLEPKELPSGECLQDTVERVIQVWKNDIAPKILSGHKILIVAHGNSLRALIKYLEKISDKDIIRLNIPTGIPLVYELDIKLSPLKYYYLGESSEVERRVAKVIKQGKSN